MPQLDLQNRSWRREIDNRHFTISTQPTLVDLDYVNAALASDDMPWAVPLPNYELQLMLDQSINLGLYEVLPPAPPATTTSSPSSPRTPSPTTDGPLQESFKQIGLVRLVTDYVTLVMITDVYVSPEYRQLGLGKWMVECCNEVVEMHPYLRRAVLIATPVVGKRFYSGFGFRDVHEEKDSKIVMTRKGSKKE